MNNMEFNKAIYTITTYRKTDETKARAKELINELSSDERKLILSILNTKDDLLAAAAGAQGLTVKLLSISAKDNTDTPIPLTHEKDAELSSCGKTMMNVWRAIKDFFGTRISDKQLLTEISKFSKDAALEEMKTIDALLANEPKDIPDEWSLDKCEDILKETSNYNLDLTTTPLGLVFNQDFSTIKDAITDEIIAALANGGRDEDLKLTFSKYYCLHYAHNFKNEFFNGINSPQPLTVKNIIEQIDQIGINNLSLDQQFAANKFLYSYWNTLSTH